MGTQAADDARETRSALSAATVKLEHTVGVIADMCALVDRDFSRSLTDHREHVALVQAELSSVVEERRESRERQRRLLTRTGEARGKVWALEKEIRSILTMDTGDDLTEFQVERKRE